MSESKNMKKNATKLNESFFGNIFKRIFGKWMQNDNNGRMSQLVARLYTEYVEACQNNDLESLRSFPETMLLMTPQEKNFFSQKIEELINATGGQLSESKKKNVVKINENTLRQIVAESVKKVLKEAVETPYGEMSTGE